ncbi:MAG: DNA-binding protein [Desulfuromonadales bacterium]|nr:DNA-binding protein [Desulfuromonadales bacterium]
MKQFTILISLAIMTFSLVACNQDKPAQPTATTATVEKSAPTPDTTSDSSSGTVVETMDAAGYTYVLVDTGSQKIWSAAPEFAVKVGDEVMVPKGMAMHNYHSQTLNRDFEVVYFVESILNASNPSMGAPSTTDMQMPSGHPAIGNDTPPEVDLSNIQKAANGMTIAEIYAGKADLANKTVTLRGKVVKFSPQIMGTNWIHLQDGSGDSAAGTNDLTVTSKTEVKVGDTIVASAPLTLNKDFGYGYKYDLIMEDAEVTVE